MPTQKTSREELIVKAMQVFRSQGYHHSSISTLAKACGIQKAHFYYYFPGGKKELMQAVLESVFQYFSERIFSIAYDQDLKPEEKLEAFLGKMERILLGGEGGCLMGITSLEVAFTAEQELLAPQLKSYFEEHKRTYDSNHRLEPKELERALSKAQKSGQLEYEHLAEFIYASFSEQIASNPSASPLDLIGYALDALKEDPEGFLMEHERPETASSHAFYGAFEKAGFNLAGLSNSTFGGQPGDQHVPLPPIIEFINRVVYGRETQLLGDARAIQQSIKRYKNQRRGQQP